MNANMMEEEMGASDNRLDLNPADYPFVENWEDGAEYTLQNVKVRQSAPGQFQVLEAQPAETDEEAPDMEAEGEPQDITETPIQAEASQAGSYSNPAVAKMLARKKA